MTKIKSYVATCTNGAEKLVAKELQSFGGTVLEIKRGSVSWQGDIEAGYRSCLWSRYSSRILLQLSMFKATDEDTLYKNIAAVNWEEHMDCDTSFAIDCTLSSGTAINHSRFAALRTKDAIADFFNERYDKRPSVKTTRPDVQYLLHINGENEGTIYLDLSGESLHRRGYREEGVIAPLKENLAAAIVASAGFLEKEYDAVVDPMCGSATLLIEAALMFGDTAPGLSRKYYGFLGWKLHRPDLWDSLVDDAIEREDSGMEKKWPVFTGYDADPRSIAAAKKNIQKAGLEDRIRVKTASLAQLNTPGGKGIIVCNPPYGERLNEKQEVQQLYRAMGRVFSANFSGWDLGLFISNAEFGDQLGIKWQHKIALHNGPIACKFLRGTIHKMAVQQSFEWQLREVTLEDEQNDFANRLKKNSKQLLKWAKKENIECFRIYDRDLPQFNFSVDLYGKWIHVQEFAPPKTIDEKDAKDRMNKGLEVIREVFGVNRDRVFIKTRSRQKGKSQYQKKASREKMYVVREGKGYFLINFTDYLDTGLFLDHRNVRLEIAEISSGKRFLNLFGYTGAATVHACLGGAVSTTTVDLSAKYLAWAKMNLALNGYGGPYHQFIQADCVRWLDECKDKFDLIFLDPPTFSNTKKEKRVFDIQNDHVPLIKRAMKLLTKDGLLIFSTNFRKFVLQKDLQNIYNLEEVTQKTIPLDFKRKGSIHKSWKITHR